MSVEPLLQDKVALITGATRGIGLGIAKTFAARGATVVLNGRDGQRLAEAAAAIEEQTGRRPLACPFDVARHDEVKKGFQALLESAGRLDILVNNAGILQGALVGMLTPEQVRRTFEVNAFGTLYCAQYASRLMMRKRSGVIINLSSIMGIEGSAGLSAYAGSKAAVVGITRSLAKELAPHRIRVNAIAPGFIDTDMARSLSEQRYREREASIGLGRAGTPEDVANCALFLASELGAYMTGQVLGVDGGMVV